MSLKTARRKAGLTQKEVAKALNVHVQSIKGWEAGKIDIPLSRLKSLIKLYKTKIDDLI